jgi:hypothetical protein
MIGGFWSSDVAKQVVTKVCALYGTLPMTGLAGAIVIAARFARGTILQG